MYAIYIRENAARHIKHGESDEHVFPEYSMQGHAVLD